MQTWLKLAFSRKIVQRAIISAVIVGFVLIAINHGDAILRGDISLDRSLKMGLTVLVPYIVSTVSSVLTILSMSTEEGKKNT
jgi:hypothetical protein